MIRQLNGVPIHFIEEGEGPPLLFLHGNPDSGDLWLPVIERVKQSFRCFAPDLPGFGRSGEIPNFDFSLNSLADLIDSLIELASIGRPLNLVVHDFGGPYGLAWAVKHATDVSGLTIMNTTFFSDYRWHFWAKVWRTPLLGELSMAGMVWPVFRRAILQGSPNLTTEQIRHAFSMITPRMKRTVLRLYRAVDPIVFKGWEDELVSLTSRIPSFVLWGDRDPYISRRFAERFRARKVVHLENCGHWIPLEEPDRLADLILDQRKTGS